MGFVISEGNAAELGTEMDKSSRGKKGHWSQRRKHIMWDTFGK